MLRFIAIFFGICFITIGVMGFIPEFTQAGKLFGLISVTTLGNFLRIITGIFALLSGLRGNRAANYFFLIVGAIYLALAAIGFYDDTSEFIRYLITTSNDNWLHAAIAAVFLYLGITYFRR